MGLSDPVDVHEAAAGSGRHTGHPGVEGDGTLAVWESPEEGRGGVGSYFFVEGVFYNDLRPGTRDLSAPLLEHCR